jgi:Domain of unknown function (DUF4412)
VGGVEERGETVTALRTVVGLVLVLVFGMALTGGSEHSTALPLPGVVLLEVRASNMEDGADTLATVICSGRVRVSYGAGHSILDTTTDRFILLDPATATYRSIPLSEWEKQVRQSPATDQATKDTLRFEPMGGEPVTIAGYSCKRYHLYSRREVFPGEFETVEQEIWVTRELDLSVSALRTYARVQASLDWIGLDAPVARPEGIAMRSSVRRHPEGQGDEADEVETYEVIAVESGNVPAAWFQIPDGYTRAESGAGGDDPDGGEGP